MILKGKGGIVIREFVRYYNCVKIFFLLLAFIDAAISSFGVVCPAFIKVYYFGLLRIAGLLHYFISQAIILQFLLLFTANFVQNAFWQIARFSFQITL